MGALTTKCTNCSTPNEVDTDLLPVGAASIHCYHCAAAIAITQIQIAEARKNPSVQEIGRGSAGRTLLSDRDRPGGPLLSPVTIVLALGVVLVFALVVTVGFVAYSRFGGGNVEGATGQARCGFHRGTGVPSGTKAWQADIVARSGFAPARSGDLIIVAGNEPRAGDAATYAPRGIDEELLDSLRALHSKMLRNGYEPMTPPEQTALQNEQAQRFQTRFEKGTCYTIAVIGGSKATDVDLLLYHSDGVRLIIADTRGDRDAHLEHCPVKSEAYEFEVRMHRGFGLVTHAIYRQTDRPFHDRGHLYALKLSDGEVAWEHPLGEQVSSSPASDEQFVAIGTRSKTRSQATRDVLEAGSVTVYNATDGSPQCSFEAAGPVLSTPTIRQGIAYFGSCGIPSSRAKNRTICDPDAPVKSQVYALRLESCDVLWSHTTTHAVIAPVAVDSERVYLTAGGKILALDLELGTLSWSSETQGHAPAPVAADGMVVYGSADGSVRSLDAASGSIRWVHETETPMTATPAVTAAAIFAAGTDGTLMAIDAVRGERLWDFTVETPFESAIGVHAGVVFALSRDRAVVVSADQGQLQTELTFEQSAGPGAAAILVDGTLIFPDGGGHILALR